MTIALCLTMAAGLVVTIGVLGQSGDAGCTPAPPREGRMSEQGRYRATDANQLIPGVPRSLVICRYAGSESTGWNLRLRSGVSVERRDIARVVQGMRVSLKPGDHSCPSLATMRQTSLVAGYADAPDLVVSISDGCGTLGNGTLRGYFASGAARSALFSALPRS
ncbi:hypothetical protein [Actinoallomurus iriomotensis]|uniref:Serine/threonine protein kinase n=1 Tax=Actinoallomurus iriomotensis TaxID=478107 RepID=A0A9W6S590_9ACTN|nr:hypothetical protein [Actinoallomurus iriomotensis]GLY87436.1 hypothetical protein Airi02_053650 [Actinoallomurus iriomotensis]